jgi:hypothetical protein
VAPMQGVQFCRQNVSNHYVHFTHSFSAPARHGGRVLSRFGETRGDTSGTSRQMRKPVTSDWV